ncbi:hypothetical protein L6R53_30895 [Myxococcota bacterium]|nr:hypothetical protein [Myxococcota bacterium]
MAGAAGSLLLLAAVGALLWGGVSGAPVVPFSDEAGHAIKALELHERMPRFGGWPDRLFRALQPGDSYPPLFHLLCHPLIDRIPGMLSMRLASAGLVMAHAVVALVLGPRLWGRPASWAYVALACGAPVMISYSSLALVDGPSAALVGIALLLLLHSDAFRRPGVAMAFALAAAAALYTKWMAGVFLAPVVAWETLRAVHATSGRWAVRALLGAGLAGLVGATGAAVWLAGLDPTLTFAMQDLQRPATFAAPMYLGLGLAALVALVGALAPRSSGGRTPPVLVAGVALLVVALLAGPWYVGAHQDLVERLVHESDQFQIRQSQPSMSPGLHMEQLADLVPAAVLALGPGVLWAVRRPSALAQALATAAGALGGTWVVLAALPEDLRYLLPAAPLVAAAAARGLGILPRSLAVPLAALVVVGQLGPSLPLVGVDLLPSHDSHAGRGGGAGVTRRGAQWMPPVPVGRVAMPDPLEPGEVDRLLEGLRARQVGGRQPLLVLQGEGQPVQGRAVRVLALLDGWPLNAQDGQWQAPLPALRADQWALAPLCEAGVTLEPALVVQARDGWCDLGLFQGQLPPFVPRPPPPPPPGSGQPSPRPQPGR